ncbi:MAG: DUF424 family protein [Nitrososphaerota archaeon]
MTEDDAPYWVKVHHSVTGEVIVAACDKGLLGKKIRISEKFETRVSEDFYMGRTANWEHIAKLIETATIINLLGDDIVNAAIEAGIVPEGASSTIGGVKHVQLIK